MHTKHACFEFDVYVFVQLFAVYIQCLYATFALPSLKTWLRRSSRTGACVHISITRSRSSMPPLRKTFPNYRKLKISWHMSCLTPINPIPTNFFSSFTGFLLNTGSSLKLLTLLSIICITHSLHIYILCCTFTLLLVP